MTNKKERKKTKSFLDLKPFKFKGKDAGQLSVKVDEIIYGWKKTKGNNLKCIKE